MTILLNVKRVSNVMVCGFDHDYSHPYSNSVKMKINYYDGEPALEYKKDLTNLCDGSKDYEIKKVKKAYNDIKQALLKDEKYVEVEL